MNWQPYLPIVTTVAGGALAVLGGFCSQLVLQKRQRLADVQSRCADKLERAGQLANEIYMSGLEQRNVALGMVLKAAAKDKSDLTLTGAKRDEFLLTVRLYAPGLMTQAKTLVDSEHAIGKLYVDELIELVGLSDPEQQKAKLSEINSAAFALGEKLKEAYNHFLSALSDTFAKYRSPQ